MSEAAAHLIEVGDDLVQKAQAFHSLVVHLGLRVEVREPRDGGEHHPDSIVGLRIQLLDRETHREPGTVVRGEAVPWCSIPCHPIDTETTASPPCGPWPCKIHGLQPQLGPEFRPPSLRYHDLHTPSQSHGGVGGRGSELWRLLSGSALQPLPPALPTQRAPPPHRADSARAADATPSAAAQPRHAASAARTPAM